MGKKGKKAQAGIDKKLTPKDISKKLDALSKKLEGELEGADLFAPLPPIGDCAICLEPLSRRKERRSFQSCCGNQICRKCLEGHDAFIKKQNEKNAGKANRKPIVRSCPFCREPEPQDDGELFRRMVARVHLNDHLTMFSLGLFLLSGAFGVSKDEMTGYHFLIEAAELGSAEACMIVALGYKGKYGFPPRSKEREDLFTRIATARGDLAARYLLGMHEYKDLENHEVGIRHWKIAAEAGDEDAFNALKRLVDADRPVPGRELITKDELKKFVRLLISKKIERGGGVNIGFMHPVPLLQISTSPASIACACVWLWPPQ